MFGNAAPFPTLLARFGLLAGFVALLFAGIAGCNNDVPAPEPPTADPAASTASTDAARAIGTDEQPVVVLETTVGTITLQLDAVQAPLTVRNFLSYVSDDFYDQTLFHYVVPDKMIVGGGYDSSGQLKPTGPAIRNEAHNGLQNRRGTIAMTRDTGAGIDSATSQFFINLCDSPSFDHQGTSPDEYGYCVFGEVIAGLDVADKISHVPTRDAGGDLAQTPDPPVSVTAARIAR